MTDGGRYKAMRADGFYDSAGWISLRYEALKQSAGRCAACGARPTETNPLHVDHIKPRSLHPELQLVLSNLQVLCKQCNLGKSNTDETDWRYVTNVDEARLVASFLLTEEEKRAKRELLDRSICGSTKAERDAARSMLDMIDQYARAAFEERRGA